MLHQLRVITLLSLAVLVLAACGYKPESGGQADDPDTNEPNRAALGAAIQLPHAEPGAVKHFLESENITNGDIYLQEGKTYINVVELTPEIEQKFADAFDASSFALNDVAYSIQELEQAQQALFDHDLYQKANIYSSMIDVMDNKVTLILPDSSQSSIPLIEEVVNPDLLHYSIQKLDEHPFVGTIVEMKDGRILFQEEGEESPNYWFSFNEYSELAGASGEEAAFEDLHAGQTVRVWITGNVDTSLPAYATVRKLELGQMPQ
ncbi:DUF3221 domain-containing protein [Paenibacillus abyssi]|uniref:DUF3221 domain-containing protein n=1 Tax=Paenibacillus abyssi TaxID=1340531 RepID=A0A917G442_9BACL|nr:DUF3221 domain-containing protein [Paenibacillus abyssi]GGG21922.1 hypothetical protein GCM10010916_43230 [Paenibacillus abyssi]